MISDKQRLSALRRMAGNIAAGLVNSRNYELPYDIESTLYDKALERIVISAVRIAEDIYDELEQRHGEGADSEATLLK